MSERPAPSLVLDIPEARYDDQPVLTDIHLELRPGERVALLGPSGAGKSTLLKIARRTVAEPSAPGAGQAPPAWIAQEPGLVANLSAFHNIYSGRLAQYPWWRNLRNLLWPERRQRVAIARLLAELELGTVLFQPAGELSGGQQQRVAIGRAIYQGATLLLADEPVAALDPPLAERMLQLLNARFDGWLMALHDVPLALAHATRVVGLQHGRVMFDLCPDEVTEAHLALLYGAPAGPLAVSHATSSQPPEQRI